MMEKRYYYLNSARTKPLGPHTTTELRNMLASGAISAATEVAAEGDKQWVPLSSVLMNQSTLPSLPPLPDVTEDLPPVPGSIPPANMPFIPQPGPATDGPAGACPACGQELKTEGLQLPPSCPNCGHHLRPQQDTLWRHALAAFTRPFTWKGRSRRKEYWSAFLFYMLLFTPLVLAATITIVAVTISVLNKTSGVQEAMASPDMLPVWIAGGIMAITALYFTLVFLAVSSRRLHDIGRSARWLLGYCVIYLTWMGFYLHRVYEYLSSINWQLLAAIDDKESLHARVEEISDRISMMYYEGPLGLLYLIVMILGISLFVFSVTDSKPGPNEYGPSPKYPLN